MMPPCVKAWPSRGKLKRTDGIMTQTFMPYSVHFAIDDEQTSYALLHALESQSQLLADEKPDDSGETEALLKANGRLLELLREAWVRSNGRTCPEDEPAP